MKVAIDQFRANLSHVRKLQAIYEAFSSMTTDALDLSDLLRAQIVMCVSALDQYVHEITRLGMVEILEGKRVPTDAFSKFTVSLDGALQGVKSTNPDWLDLEIRKKHGYQSFQVPDKIADAIRLFKDLKLWQEVSAQLSMKPEDVKRELSLIVDRRNKIAHEADLDPTYPGQRWPITVAMAGNTTNFIEKVCETIHTLII